MLTGDKLVRLLLEIADSSKRSHLGRDQWNVRNVKAWWCWSGFLISSSFSTPGSASIVVPLLIGPFPIIEEKAWLLVNPGQWQPDSAWVCWFHSAWPTWAAWLKNHHGGPVYRLPGECSNIIVLS